MRLFFLTAILTATLFSSCKDDDGILEVKDFQELIIGKWIKDNSPCQQSYPDFEFTETTLKEGNTSFSYEITEDDTGVNLALILVDGQLKYRISVLTDVKLTLVRSASCVLHFDKE